MKLPQSHGIGCEGEIDEERSGANAPSLASHLSGFSLGLGALCGLSGVASIRFSAAFARAFVSASV